VQTRLCRLAATRNGRRRLAANASKGRGLSVCLCSQERLRDALARCQQDLRDFEAALDCTMCGYFETLGEQLQRYGERLQGAPQASQRILLIAAK
jgi:hypothetical protein